MEGFFTREQTAVKSVSPADRIAGCGKCKLNKTAVTPQMVVSGEGRRGILVVGEAPGETEDTQGTQFVGKTGRVLRGVCKTIGLDLDQDCWKTHAVVCRSPGELNGECVTACRPFLFKTIRDLRPKCVIALGGSAVLGLLGHKWSEDMEGVGKWRGWTIPDRENKCWICPTFSPAYIMQQSDRDVAHTIWQNDLIAAVHQAETPFPNIIPERECVKILRKTQDIVDYLDWVIEQSPKMIAFDYETTGLKPHKNGHLIRTMSIADSPRHAAAFPLWPQESEVIERVRRILGNPRIGKIAHNHKFEHMWSREKLDVEVQGWAWDTIMGAHVRDNRPGICALDYQAMLVFGLLPWDAGVSEYLTTPDDNPEGGNALNRILECPLQDLLLYNGIDSIVEYRLAQRQVKELNYVF